MSPHPSLTANPIHNTRNDMPRQKSWQNKNPKQKASHASPQKKTFQIPVIHNPPHILNLNAQPLNRFRTGYKRPTLANKQPETWQWWLHSRGPVMPIVPQT
jgi:hypothetical protein